MTTDKEKGPTKKPSPDEPTGRCDCPFERTFRAMWTDPNLAEARTRVRGSTAEMLRAVRALIDWGIERADAEEAAAGGDGFEKVPVD